MTTRATSFLSFIMTQNTVLELSLIFVFAGTLSVLKRIGPTDLLHPIGLTNLKM